MLILPPSGIAEYTITLFVTCATFARVMTDPSRRWISSAAAWPAMAASGLQYIVPALAGIATAEGRFSIELEGCRIPIDAPARGELAGRMIVHSVQIGPGHLLQAYLSRFSIAKLSKIWPL